MRWFQFLLQHSRPCLGRTHFERCFSNGWKNDNGDDDDTDDNGDNSDTDDIDDHFNKHDNNDDNNDDSDSGGDEDDDHHTRKLTLAILVMWPGRLSIVQRDNTNCTNCWFVKTVCFWIVRGTTILLYYFIVLNKQRYHFHFVFWGSVAKKPRVRIDGSLPAAWQDEKNQCCWGVVHDLQQLCFFSWCGHA